MSDKRLVRLARKTFVLQSHQMDCGIAALASTIQYHGGYIELEKLRLASGTNLTGTTMLGIMHAAIKYQLNCDAFEGTIEELKRIDDLTILHVVKNNSIDHYILCYGFFNGTFLIADPSLGVVKYKEFELENIWESKALLVLSPKETFEKSKKNNYEKFSWILLLLNDHRNLIKSTTLVGLLISILGFATAVFTEKLIDNIIPFSNKSTIIVSIISWLIIILFRVVLIFLRELGLANQTYKFNNNIIKEYLNHLFNLPLNYFNSRKTGDLIARLFDNEKIQNSTQRIFSTDMLELFSLIVSLTIISIYNAQIALFLVFSIPFYFLIIYNYQKGIYKSNKELQESIAINESQYIDSISGILTIKHFFKQKVFLNQLLNGYNNYQLKNLKLSVISAKFRFLIDIFGILSMSFILTYSLSKVISGEMQVGDMIAIISISGISFISTNKLAQSISHIQEAIVALDRTFDVLCIDKEDSGLNKINGENIKIVNVSFQYSGYLPLLENVSCEFYKNQITLVAGKNGAGKSTFIQLIQGLLTPSSGSIIINNQSIQNLSTKELRSFFGCVPQEIKIFNSTLLFNVTLDDNPDMNYFNSLLEYYGLTDFINSFPFGIKSLLGEEGIKVSGGQRQLIGLLRALYHNPTFLILDEFTSSMDKKHKILALNLVKLCSRKMGVIIVSHDELFHSIANNIYVIENQGIT